LGSVRHVLSGHYGFLLQDLHGPLYTGVCALFAWALQGEGLRLISAVASALAVLPIHAWARRVAGDGVALIAGLLVAFSPFAVWYGQELRNYSFVLLLSACTFLVLESWRGRDPGIKGLLAFVLCAWLGLLSNLTFLLLVIAAAVALLAGNSGRRLRTFGWLALAAALLLLLSLPWVLSFVTQMAPQRLVVDMPAWDEAPLRGETTFTPLALPYTFYSLLAGFSLGPSLAELHWGPGQAVRAHLPVVAAAMLLFGVTTLAGFFASERRRKLEWLLILLVVLGLASFLAIKNFKVYNVRYVSMLWPLLLLLVARGIHGFPVAFLRKPLLAATLIAFAVSLAQHYWKPAYSKEDCRAAASRMETLAGSEELIVIAVVTEPFLHYYQGSSKIGSLWPGQSAQSIGEKVTQWGSPSRLWLVSAREWEWGSVEMLLGAFSEYRVGSRETLPGVKIYELNKVR